MKNAKKENQTFEDIRHIDENGVEFWVCERIDAYFGIFKLAEF